jgi:hypothetical protein
MRHKIRQTYPTTRFSVQDYRPSKLAICERSENQENQQKRKKFKKKTQTQTIFVFVF